MRQRSLRGNWSPLALRKETSHLRISHASWACFRLRRLFWGSVGGIRKEGLLGWVRWLGMVGNEATEMLLVRESILDGDSW